MRTLKVKNKKTLLTFFFIIHSFLAAEEKSLWQDLYDKTDFGAWSDVTLSYSRTESNDDDESFGSHVYAYGNTKFNNRWSLFTEIEYEYDSDGTDGDAENELILERLKLKYTHSDAFKLTIGKFNTPWGIWTPEHWTINVDTITKPLHDENTYVPRKSIGLMIEGLFFPSDNTELKYSFIIANGVGQSGSNKPEGDDLGAGLDLRLTMYEKYTLGTSFYTQEDSPSDRQQDSFLYYFNFELPWNLTLRSEGMLQHRDGPEDHVQTFYVKLKWQFHEKWYINYRYDTGDDTTLQYDGKHTINSITLAYFPTNKIRLKLEFADHRVDSEVSDDYQELLLRVGYIF